MEAGFQISPPFRPVPADIMLGKDTAINGETV